MGGARGQTLAHLIYDFKVLALELYKILYT